MWFDHDRIFVISCHIGFILSIASKISFHTDGNWTEIIRSHISIAQVENLIDILLDPIYKLLFYK